jgi:hypothetical protein
MKRLRVEKILKTGGEKSDEKEKQREAQLNPSKGGLV